MCPPERPRSGVSIPKILALCAGDERRMRPCRATRAGTQAPPLPISIIFFHTIPYKQNNHLRAIHPNEINHSTRNLPKRRQPSMRNLPKRNRRGGACVPARTSAQRRFHTKNTCIVRGEWMMDAPLQGDTGGHTGTAPTKLRYTSAYNPPKRYQPPKRNTLTIPSPLHTRGRKCIAHSRPLNSK